MEIGVEEDEGTGEGVDIVGAAEEGGVALVVPDREVVEDLSSLGALARQAHVLEEVTQRSVESDAREVELLHEVIRDTLG